MKLLNIDVNTYSLGLCVLFGANVSQFHKWVFANLSDRLIELVQINLETTV